MNTLDFRDLGIFKLKKCLLIVLVLVMDPRKTPRFAKRITPYGYGQSGVLSDKTHLADKENIPPVKNLVPVKREHLNTCGGCLAEYSVDIKPLFPGNFAHSPDFNGFSNQLLARAEKVLKNCEKNKENSDILQEFASIFTGCQDGLCGQSNGPPTHTVSASTAPQQF